MLKSEVAFLKKQYPNVTTLLEDGIETNLSDLDKNVVFRIYNLQIDIGYAVLKEALKMAFKSGWFLKFLGWKYKCRIDVIIIPIVFTQNKFVLTYTHKISKYLVYLSWKKC